MRKIFIVTFVIAASFSLCLGQGQQGNSTAGKTDIPNMGSAPKEINGIGRLDLRVVDENGNPIKGAFAKLESRRTDGFFCESWSPTDEHGVAVLPPIHMGHLTLIIKAKGYQTIKMEVPLDSLAEPVHVTLHTK